MKKSILCVLLCLLVLGGTTASHLLYLSQHCEFTPSDFQHRSLVQRTPATCPPDSPLTQQASDILSQPFLYLGRGRQMTAYESADHRYVIKFFNPRTFLKKKWFRDVGRLRRLVSLKWLSRAYFKRHERLMRLSQRYQMAFDELREESGLIYVHLNPSTTLSQALTLVDKQGKQHSLDLRFTPFILQKKSQLVLAQFDTLLQQGDLARVQKGIEQLHTLFLSRAQKGFTDRIQTLHNNYGFVDGRAIQIDLGGIQKVASIQQDPSKELERIFAGISKKLLGRYPQFSPTLTYFLSTYQREAQ